MRGCEDAKTRGRGRRRGLAAVGMGGRRPITCCGGRKITMAFVNDTAAGVALGVLTAIGWAISPLCFASAGRRIGSHAVVVMRLLAAGAMFAVLAWPYALMRSAAPAMPDAAQLMWLALSGLAGAVVGDMMFFEALVRLGPRRASQAGVIAPVVSVATGWLALGEALGLRALAGVVLVLAASSYAIFAGAGTAAREPSGDGGEPGSVSVVGVLLGIGGAVGAGVGAVLARQAFCTGPPLDPVIATVVRVDASAIMLGAFAAVRGQLVPMLAKLRDRHILTRMLAGTLAGPFLGMLCYVAALAHIEAGLVSTLAAMSPVFILPLVAVRYKARIGWDVVVATVLAAAGVGLICLR